MSGSSPQSQSDWTASLEVREIPCMCRAKTGVRRSSPKPANPGMTFSACRLLVCAVRRGRIGLCVGLDVLEDLLNIKHWKNGWMFWAYVVMASVSARGSS